MRSLVVLVLFSSLALADTKPRPLGARRSSREVKPERKIVEAEFGRDYYYERGAVFWTPTRIQVDRLERGLRSYMKRIGPSIEARGDSPIWKDLDGYSPWYVGVVRFGKKMIFITAGPPGDEACDDCGCRKWWGWFDPRTNEYSGFSCGNTL